VKRGHLFRAGLLLALTALLAACGPGKGGNGRQGTSAACAGGQRIQVLYAGSLVRLMEQGLAPAFQSATGCSGFQGFPGGSKELANEIKGRVRQANAFISADPGPDRLLMGRANGDWVSWYAVFARSSLLLAYNPKSPFAHQLRTKPWWKVVTEPGFRLGRTDPRLDPKGKLSVQALEEAARAHHDPALAVLTRTQAGVFPEEDLVSRLQSGQLDAGFFYRVEAESAHLPTVGLGGLDLAAKFTVTIPNRAPDRLGAETFVRFLLGREARTILANHGLTPMPPTVAGNVRAVPATLRSVLGG
jgi:molybdate/tungstate transport system substrate-binding protein